MPPDDGMRTATSGRVGECPGDDARGHCPNRPASGPRGDRLARRRLDEPTRRRLDIHRRELRRELSRLRDRRRLLAMGLLILTFGFLAAGIVGRGEPAGADARAYWAGGPDLAQRRRPVPPDRAVPALRLRPVDAAAVRAVGAAAVGRRLVRLARRDDPRCLLWTIHWAYRQRPLETAILVALLGFPFGANLDTGNINLLLTLMLWGAQFTGPVVAGLLWSVATWMKWAPVLLLPILAPRARLWGLVFLAASALLSLATLPLTILQLQALFGFGARPLRLDYLVFLWALVPVLWRRPDPFDVAPPASWWTALARLRSGSQARARPPHARVPRAGRRELGARRQATGSSRCRRFGGDPVSTTGRSGERGHDVVDGARAGRRRAARSRCRPGLLTKSRTSPPVATANDGRRRRRDVRQAHVSAG